MFSLKLSPFEWGSNADGRASPNPSNEDVNLFFIYLISFCIVEPRSTDSCIYRTVSFVSTKRSYIFFKIYCFIRTPVKDNGQISVSLVTNAHISSSTPLYGH